MNANGTADCADCGDANLMIAVIIGRSIGDDSAGVKEISEEIDGGLGKTGKFGETPNADFLNALNAF